jgi:hypothetical protein
MPLLSISVKVDLLFPLCPEGAKDISRGWPQRSNPQKGNAGRSRLLGEMLCDADEKGENSRKESLTPKTSPAKIHFVKSVGLTPITYSV